MRLDRIARRLILGATGLAASSSPSPAARAADGPTGVVYVQSNVSGSGANGVFGFRRDDSGDLTPLPGSPFKTGGSGISPSFALGPYDSDQEIIAGPGNLLLVANGGSDSIAVLRLAADGTPTPVPGSPFPSGGVNPVSLGLRGNCLTVVNKDMDPGRAPSGTPNYATLTLTAGGALVPSRRPAQISEIGSSPTQALVARDAPLVFGCDFLGGTIRSFRIRAGGLVPVEAIAAPAGLFEGTGKPPYPLGMAAHPRRDLVYVGFVTINKMGVYRYAKSGALEFLDAVDNSGQGICWITPSRGGDRLYTSNTADNSVSVYDSSGPRALAPVEIQKLTLRGTAAAYQIALDPSGRFFYVVTQKDAASKPDSANALHVLSVGADGTLAEVASSPTVLPVPEGARPQGVVAF